MGKQALLAESLPERREKPTESLRSWNAWVSSLSLLSDATVFQTGNVFYEILFSAVGMDSYESVAYFGFSVITLVIGCTVLVIFAQLMFWGSAVNSAATDKKIVAEWVNSTWHMHNRLKWLYTISLLTWECAMVFSSSVKYPRLRDASAYWSLFGIAMITLVSARAYCIMRGHTGTQLPRCEASSDSSGTEDTLEEDSETR